MYFLRELNERKKKLIINFFLSLIPLSFILGNLIINLNILIIIIISLLFFNKRILEFNFSIIEKSVLIFFVFTLFTGLWNHITIYSQDVNDDNVVILKSILLLRFLFFVIIIRFLVQHNIFNFRWFFLSALFFTVFVGVDIIYQFLFSKDIFGIEPATPRKLSGPFAEELIAGGYIQRFSIFSFFSLPLFLKIKQPYLSIILSILFCVFLFSIILSGNRMPLLLFLFSIFLVLLFEKNTRKYLLSIIFCIFVIFSLSYLFNNQVKTNFDHLSRNLGKIVTIFLMDTGLQEKKPIKGDVPLYYQEFRSFYETWKLNKYIGGGVKSYRENCKKRRSISNYEREDCNTHPHNYYLEIISDLGLTGLILALFIFSAVIYKSINQNYVKSNYSNKIMIAVLFVFAAEIIPIRSSGSFFTTGNASFIFFLLAILLGSLKKYNH